MPGPIALRDFAARYTAAWCSHDPAGVASFFAPAGSLTVNNAAPAIGRDAITAVAQGFMTAFPDLRVIMDAVEQQGAGAVYRWTLIGANTGPGGTGRSVRISGSETWTFDDASLIVSSEGRFDEAEYQRQLQQGFN